MGNAAMKFRSFCNDLMTDECLYYIAGYKIDCIIYSNKSKTVTAGTRSPSMRLLGFLNY